MKKIHIVLGALLALAIAGHSHGQATIGYHRVAQILARGSSGAEAVLQPYSTVAVTVTATGLGATIYSDPLLTAPIIPSFVTADEGGNYDYYIPLGYCVTETITYPSSGGIVIPNVCVISSTLSGSVNAGTTGQLGYYASNGNIISGENFATIPQGGTGATTAAGAWTNILAGSLAAPNTVLAGPTSGPDIALAARALVSGDIPDNAANTTGNANTATLAASATALAGSPTQCMGGQVATGIASSGNANCLTPSMGLTQINGGGTDATTPAGGGVQPLTLNTVNGSPGACGDATHVCRVTTNGKGLTTAQTAVAITFASGFTTGSNGNGSWVTDPTGTITERGSITVTNGGGTLVTGAITFPLTFPTSVDILVITAGNNPGGSNDALTDYYTGLTTSGATVVVRCSTNIGGSGCGSISNTVPITWIAIGK